MHHSSSKSGKANAKPNNNPNYISNKSGKKSKKSKNNKGGKGSKALFKQEQMINTLVQAQTLDSVQNDNAGAKSRPRTVGILIFASMSFILFDWVLQR